MTSLMESFNALRSFLDIDLRSRISRIESALSGSNNDGVNNILANENISQALFSSALAIKDVASKIDIVVHSVGILTYLPYILENGEVISSVSLGAGNTGRRFDLETDRRIAEFKFTNWRGGPESIRQNEVFKDFFGLESENTAKMKFLYLTGTEKVNLFFNGRRSLQSVMSKNEKTKSKFRNIYGDKFKYVRDYYQTVKTKVSIVDLNEIHQA